MSKKRKLSEAKGMPKADGPCGRDAQGTLLVYFEGQCWHPNALAVHKARQSTRIGL